MGQIVKVRRQKGGRGDITYYISIPKPIYRLLGEPEAFDVILEEGKLILRPLTARNKEVPADAEHK